MVDPAVSLTPSRPQPTESTSRPEYVERSVSQRLLQPFVRWFNADADCTALLTRLGIGAAELVDPATRMPVSACRTLLRLWLLNQNDPTIGLRAATTVLPGDWDIVEQAARHCETLEEAIQSAARYLPILHETATLILEKRGPLAVVTLGSRKSDPGCPAADDFAVAALFKFVVQNVVSDLDGWEAWFTHEEPRYRDAYRHAFTIPIRFAAPVSGLAFPVTELARPLRLSNAWLAKGFATQADVQLDEGRNRGGVAGRVRQLVVHKLGNERLSMRWVATCLGLSVPTLRRRLDAEGTTFTDIVAQVRLERAEALLTEGNRSVGEVATLVGYAGIAGLNRALLRHAGMTAGAYKEQLRTPSKSDIRELRPVAERDARSVGPEGAPSSA